MEWRKVILAFLVYVVLAAADLASTYYAVGQGKGFEANKHVRDLVHEGRYDILMLLNMIVYLPFSLAMGLRNRIVRIFARGFFYTTLVLRTFTIVNNLLICYGFSLF
ncbi:MAG: hypothetical protein QW794_00230 [Thermosphaera sp.]